MCLSAPNAPASGAAPSRAAATAQQPGAARAPDSNEPAQTLARALASLAERPEEAVSLAVCLPFCAVHCLCCDRDIRAGQPQAVMQAYMARLEQEIDQLAVPLGGQREVMQLHLGGGSANLFSPTSLVGLMQRLRRHWRIPRDAELSVECDARSVGWVQLQLLRHLGFDQVHFGVFDLDARVQQAIGRVQSAALIDDACGLAREAGFTGIRLGLMVGLPGQTEAGWRETLRQAIAMAPARIHVARYRHRPGLVAGQYAIDAHALPSPSEVLELLQISADALRAVGYRWIGTDLFVLDEDPLAQAQDESRLGVNLLGHTAQPPMALLAVGRGAVGEVDGCLYWNHAAPQAWQTAVAQGRLPVAEAWQADAASRRRRAAAEQLLCCQTLPAALTTGELAALVEAIIRQAPAGSVLRLADRLVVPDRGRGQLPALCAELAGLPMHVRQPLPPWLN